MTNSSDPVEMEWTRSSEEYPSIGTVDYHFALLNQARKKVPEPPEPQQFNFYNDPTVSEELSIQADFQDVYMTVWNIAGRVNWISGLLRVEQDTPNAFIGSIHHCIFEKCRATVSPLRMTFTDEGIMYAESCRIPEMNLRVDPGNWYSKKRATKVVSSPGALSISVKHPLPEETSRIFFDRLKTIMDELKNYSEKMEASFLEPLVR